MRALLLCMAMSGCALFPSVGDLGGGDAAAEVSTIDATSGDGSTDVTTDVTESDAGACPGTGGPASVRVGTFCIDATEVTNAQYKQFVVASVGTSRAECAWKASYVPSSAWPPGPGADNYPVAYVDWCDATAFCEWAAAPDGPTLDADAHDTTRPWQRRRLRRALTLRASSARS